MQFKKNVLVLLVCTALLAACGEKEHVPGEKTTVDGVADELLPTPAGTPGSAVTGMPKAPGPGDVAAVSEEVAAEEVALDADGNPLPPVDESSDAAVEVSTEAPAEAAAVAAAADEPSAQDAVAVVRDYYAAISGGAFARAYALWSDGGRSSGQSPQQFADGFANTMGVSAQIGAPGPIEGAAGSRFIEIPVSLIAGQREGGERRFEGTYTLRRAMVDGATPEHRAWRIASATLHEIE